MPRKTLDSHLQGLCDGFRRWWEQKQDALDIAEQVTVPLYHYTNMAGLTGILTSQEVWFSNLLHLNDPSEFSHGSGLFTDRLRSAGAGASPAVQRFCQEMEKALASEITKLFGFYVASFSRAGDDLGQWRAYGNDGHGVAIGFAPHLFQVKKHAHPLPLRENVMVASVVYDRTIAMARADADIGEAVRIINQENGSGNLSGPWGFDFLKEMSIELAVPAIQQSMTTKNDAYRHEQEVRLLIVNNIANLTPIIETRTRGASTIPFIRSPMDLRAAGNVHEVVIGPAAPATTVTDVRNLLASLGMASVPVRRSEIPYRTF